MPSRSPPPAPARLPGHPGDHGPDAVLSYWGIGLPVGYLLGLTDWLGEPTGPRGLWQGLIVGLTVAAVMLSFRVARSARLAHPHGRTAGRGSRIRMGERLGVAEPA